MPSRTIGGNLGSKLYLAAIRSASWMVVGSGSVGPDARADSCPAGTSLIASVSFVENGAAAARRPPLVAERCLRIALISSMGAPQVTSACVQPVEIARESWRDRAAARPWRSLLRKSGRRSACGRRNAPAAREWHGLRRNFRHSAADVPREKFSTRESRRTMRRVPRELHQDGNRARVLSPGLVPWRRMPCQRRWPRLNRNRGDRFGGGPRRSSDRCARASVRPRQECR